MIDCIAFSPDRGLIVGLAEAVQLLQQGRLHCWLDLENPQAEEVSYLSSQVGIPEQLFDLKWRRQDRKVEIESVEDFDMFGFYVPTTGKSYSIHPWQFIIRNNLLLTVRETTPPFLSEIKAKLKRHPELLAQGMGKVVAGILGESVNLFLSSLEENQAKLDRLEEGVLAHPDRTGLNKVFKLRKQVGGYYRCLMPNAEVLHSLSLHEDGRYFDRQTHTRLAELNEELLRIADLYENYYDRFHDLLEAHLSLSSYRTNEIVRVLTVITTILMPLTVITGIYGMNFQHMPELHWRYGYYVVLAGMGVIVSSLLYYFHRKGWI
ncbi:MAG: magnesium/cobalt transporter CorA [Clostridia bacterium]|nr:magnesium/cobalt transporter CorA [Clostridia bacterium]